LRDLPTCRTEGPLVTHVLLDALVDALLMVPWLFLVYLGVAWLERRLGHAMHDRLVKLARFGPVLGMVAGLLPQCGFSVVAAALYCQRLITKGTLVAVLLATSDEALPIILSRREHLPALVPVLLGKIVIATLGGYLVDAVFARRRLAPESCGHEHQHGQEVGCCHHGIPAQATRWALLSHPIRHTISVFLMVLATLVALGAGLHAIGEERLGEVLLRGSYLQPVVAGLVGLIPNCAISVVLTETMLLGHLGYGAAMAGLCASGGLGLLVLVRENRDLRDVLQVVLSVLVLSVTAGLVITAFSA